MPGLKGFPLYVLFRLLGDNVEIIAVSHTSQRAGYWKSRLKAPDADRRENESGFADQAFSYIAMGSIPPPTEFSDLKPGSSRFAAALAETWRGSPFVNGQSYRVIAPAQSWIGSLAPGDLLVYQRSSYSPYDEVSVYIFRDTALNERTWILRDDEPLEIWQKVFQVVAKDR